MSNVFKQNREVTQNPKRNNHDLSFQSHSTFKFGYYYPVLCKPCVQGDSFRISTLFDLKMMPLAFPLQSRIRAYMHYFYVPIKNIWPHFMTYITGQPRVNPYVHPYLKIPQSSIKTGSIHDFLGVPTTVVTKSSVSGLCPYYGFNPDSEIVEQHSLCVWYCDNTIPSLSSSLHRNQGARTKITIAFNLPSSFSLFVPDFDFSHFAFKSYLNEYISKISGNQFVYIFSDDVYTSRSFSFSYDSDSYILKLEETSKAFINEQLSIGKKVTILLYTAVVSDFDVLPDPILPADYENGCGVSTFISDAGVHEYSDLNLSVFDNDIHLNALPYRAYESVYRAYYASDVWQPLVIDGEKEYNIFNQNTGDGEDTVDYHLFRRNYESDFLTSALPSPQSGNAPLVGMSALGDITIESEDGVTNARAELDSNGNITGVSVTSPLASVQHARTLMNIAQVGMNINDFRNANALQKFLEQTLRSGYRYADFIRGQFGHTPKDVAQDMPTFIGGFTRDVMISTVVSTADTASGSSGKYLGDFGGNGRVVGGSDYDVNFYCPDYGFILGILSIVPTPSYSQLLPKHMICPKNYLDYYNPNFAQLGMQAIPYTEVAPLQSYIDSISDPSKKLTDTFGYQRPNYDMVASVDEVHGEFRSTLKDYLINRQFDGRPELGSEFLEVNPSEINDVFVNSNPDDDVFIGNLLFNIFAKRPVPRIHIPHL